MEGGLGTDTPRKVNYYTLGFDGHSVEKRSSGGRKVGDEFPVIYLANRPSSVVRGSRAIGVWNTIKKSTNESNLVVATAVGVFFLLCAARRQKAVQE